MQPSAVQVVSKANPIKYITAKRCIVNDEDCSSLNFIFSSLNDIATKHRNIDEKPFVSKPTFVDEISNDLSFSSLVETKIAVKNVFIVDRDEDNAIAISHRFVYVRDDF